MYHIVENSLFEFLTLDGKVIAFFVPPGDFYTHHILHINLIQVKNSTTEIKCTSINY